MPRLALLSMLAAAVVCSCGKDESPSAGDGDEFAVRKSYGNEQVGLTVELSTTSVTLADAVTWRMTMSVADGYEAELPDLVFPDDVAGAILTDFEEREETEGDRLVRVREYELEPEFVGTLTLPAMEVYYNRAGEVEDEWFGIEPMDIAVEAIPESADALDLKPARGLVTVERMEAERRRIWPWVLAGAAGSVLLVALVVYLVRRPRPAPPPPPADRVALSRLRELADRDLIGLGRIEPFFVEVTAIVRDYIEGAFGVRAPEQTTEEFLLAMVTEPAVARHREVLQPFLTAADQVKFARLTPAKPAMQRAFDTARDFVVETAGTGGSAS